MKTPAGTECAFFYGNYFRGRNLEECRLIGKARPPRHWTRDLCKTCPVPGILRANSCPNMKLTASVVSFVFRLFPRIKVSAFCTKSQETVQEPHIGCGECHPLPEIFTQSS